MKNRMMILLMLMLMFLFSAAQTQHVYQFDQYTGPTELGDRGDGFTIMSGVVRTVENQNLCQYTRTTKTCNFFKGLYDVEGNHIFRSEGKGTRMDVLGNNFTVLNTLYWPDPLEGLMHTPSTTYLQQGPILKYQVGKKWVTLDYSSDIYISVSGIEEDQDRLLLYYQSHNEAGPTMPYFQAEVLNRKTGQLIQRFYGEVLGRTGHLLYLFKNAHQNSPVLTVVNLKTLNITFELEVKTQTCRALDVLDSPYAFAFLQQDHVLLYLPGSCESRMLEIDPVNKKVKTYDFPAVSNEFYLDPMPVVQDAVFDHLSAKLRNQPLWLLEGQMILGSQSFYNLRTGQTISHALKVPTQRCAPQPSPGTGTVCIRSSGTVQGFVYLVTSDHRLMLFRTH